MTEILSNPIQIGGWLLILLSVAVLTILCMTRKSPGQQQDELFSEVVQHQEEGTVVEGSLEVSEEDTR